MDPVGFSLCGVVPRRPHETSLFSSQWFPSLANLAEAVFVCTLVQAIDVKKNERELWKKDEWKQLKSVIREV